MPTPPITSRHTFAPAAPWASLGRGSPRATGQARWRYTSSISEARAITSRGGGGRLGNLRAEDAHALVDGIPDLVFRIAADGTYLGFKAEREEQLAVAPDRIVGSTVRELLPPHVAGPIMGAVEGALAERTVQTIEYDLVLGGLERSFEGRAVARGDDEVLFVVRDLTELRRRERELEHERTFTHTVVHAAASYLLLVDGEGRVLGLNDRLARASGFGNDETVGTFFWEAFLAPEDVEEARASFHRAVAAGLPGARTFHHVSRDGEHHMVEWTATPVIDHEGHQRVILSGLDVTERVRHEEELRQSRARIVEAGDAERKRLERNLHDGAQQLLVVVSQTLHRAVRALHEDPARTEDLILQALEQLGHAHAELRELARGLHPALLADRGLEAALGVLARRCPVPTTLEVDLHGARPPEVVQTAGYYLVAEALTNAAKYSRASQVRVRLHLEADRLVVEVADDGVGGAETGGGTGLLGLADRMEALGGSLAVTSPPGEGTRIRAELPLARRTTAA